MSETDRKTRKIYYSMGEVSEMFDVNPSLIRFWEQKFSILKPEKNKKGNRLFTQQDVDNLKLIYHLVKENGMTLAGAQKRLKENREGLERNLEIIERLQSIKTLLLEVRQELKEAEVRVDEIRVDADSSNEWPEDNDALEMMESAASGSVSPSAAATAQSENTPQTAVRQERLQSETARQEGSMSTATTETPASLESGSEPQSFRPQEQPLFPEYVTPESAITTGESERSAEGSIASEKVSGTLQGEDAISLDEDPTVGKRMQIIEQTLF